ncbi:MAG: hypothetical protein MHPDNHAH_01222 [Anaerolineales bacterium]|nr:hypothetical protein [Anaerolineales bacterium]
MEPSVNLFIAIILAGLIVYELFTGTIPMRYGATHSRKRSVSRSEKPIQFWIWVAVQAVFAALFGFGIIKL